MDGSDSQNPPLIDTEYADILQPLYTCRRYSMLATLFSSIYIIGFYAIFKDFYFLMFHPIFYCIITCLQTMAFVRNRYFVRHQIFFCCHCKFKQSADDETTDNHKFNQNEANDHHIQVTMDFADTNRQQKNNGNKVQQVDDVMDVMDVMDEEIQSKNVSDTEELEMSGLLCARQSIGSPNSTSTALAINDVHIVPIDEDNALIDFREMMTTPTNSRKLCASSPTTSMILKAPTRFNTQEINILNINDLLYGQNVENDQDVVKDEDVDGGDGEEPMEGNESNECEGDKIEGRVSEQYKLDKKDLMLTLLMLVNSGLVEKETASNVRRKATLSAKKDQQRIAQISERVKDEGKKVGKSDEEVSFLFIENANAEEDKSSIFAE